MTKRKGIYVYGGGECWLLTPSDSSSIYHDDIYGDTYENKKYYWKLVESEPIEVTSDKVQTAKHLK
jgi:hypothetical protein